MPHPAVIAGCVIAGAATVVAFEVAIFRPWREKHGEGLISNAQYRCGHFQSEWSSAFDRMNPMHPNNRRRRRSSSSSGEETLREIEAFELERRLAGEDHQATLDHQGEMQSLADEEDATSKRYNEGMNATAATTSMDPQIGHDGDESGLRRRRGSVIVGLGHINSQFDHMPASCQSSGGSSPMKGQPPPSESKGFDHLSASSDVSHEDHWSSTPLSPSLRTYQDIDQSTLTDASWRNYLEDDADDTTGSPLLLSPAALSPRSLSSCSSPVDPQIASARSTSPLSSSDRDWQHESTTRSSSQHEGSGSFTQLERSPTDSDGDGLAVLSMSSASTMSDGVSPEEERLSSPRATSEGGGSEDWEKLSEGSSSSIGDGSSDGLEQARSDSGDTRDEGNA